METANVGCAAGHGELEPDDPLQRLLHALFGARGHVCVSARLSMAGTHTGGLLSLACFYTPRVVSPPPFSRKVMEQLEVGGPSEQSEADPPQADDIPVNEVDPVMRVAGNGVELVPMTFGFPPKSPRGSPVFNFKSEGRRFGNSSRCLIPASAFFEFTGKRDPKAKHRFALKDASLMAIAGCSVARPPAMARRLSPCCLPRRART